MGTVFKALEKAKVQIDSISSKVDCKNEILRAFTKNITYPIKENSSNAVQTEFIFPEEYLIKKVE